MKTIITMALALSIASGLTGCQASAENPQEQEKATLVTQERVDITDIKHQYALQSRLFLNVISEISDEEANTRLSDNINSLLWIAGHTLDLLHNIAMMTGATTSNPYGEQFGYGKPFDSQGNYPSLSEMREDWKVLSPKVEEALGNLDASALKSELPFQIPFAEQNLKGFLAFQMHHLGYEIGQLGLYRKSLGKEAMSYQ